MATFEEHAKLPKDPGFGLFSNKVLIAIKASAQEVFDEATPGANRLDWADQALNDPSTCLPKALNYILMKNRAATTATILGAPDEGAGSIKLNVDAWRDKLYPAGV